MSLYLLQTLIKWIMLFRVKDYHYRKKSAEIYLFSCYLTKASSTQKYNVWNMNVKLKGVEKIAIGTLYNVQFIGLNWDTISSSLFLKIMAQWYFKSSLWDTFPVQWYILWRYSFPTRWSKVWCFINGGHSISSSSELGWNLVSIFISRQHQLSTDPFLIT